MDPLVAIPVNKEEYDSFMDAGKSLMHRLINQMYKALKDENATEAYRLFGILAEGMVALNQQIHVSIQREKRLAREN